MLTDRIMCHIAYTDALSRSGVVVYDGVTLPRDAEWDDAHVPRTDRPVRFAAKTRLCLFLLRSL